MANKITDTPDVHIKIDPPELKAQVLAKLPRGVTLTQAVNLCLRAIAKGTIKIPAPEVDTSSTKH